MPDPAWYAKLKEKIKTEHYSVSGSQEYLNEKLGKIPDELDKYETVIDGVTLEYQHEAFFDVRQQEGKLAWVFWKKGSFQEGYGISFEPYSKDQIAEKLKTIPAAKPEQKPVVVAAAVQQQVQHVQQKEANHMSEEKSALQTLTENGKKSMVEAGKLSGARLAMEAAKAPFVAKLAAKYGKDEGTAKAIVEFFNTDAGTGVLMGTLSVMAPFAAPMMPKKMRGPAMAASEVMMTRSAQMVMEGVGMELLDVMKTFVTMYMATQEDVEEEEAPKVRVDSSVTAELPKPAAESHEVERVAEKVSARKTA